MKNKLYLVTVLAVIAFCICQCVAYDVEDSFNVSVSSATSANVGYEATTGGSSSAATINFRNTGSIAGVTDIKINAVQFLLNGPAIMSHGSWEIPVSVAGAGDSYSLTRVNGTLTINPISNVTGYILGTPQYSSSACIASISLHLNSALEYKSGDTTQFRIYNLSDTSGYTWGKVAPNLFNSPSGSNVAVKTASLFFTAADTNMGAISLDLLAFSMKDSTIYGYSFGSALSTTTYDYRFENIFSIDSVSKAWSINKNINGKTGLSQLNLTDGSGFTYYYPLDSANNQGTFSLQPVKLKLTEPRFGIVFEKTYFGTLGYQISVSPLSGPKDTTFSGLISSGNLTDIKEFKWLYYDTNNNPYDFFSDTTETQMFDYERTGSIWYQYNVTSSIFDINKGSSIPNPALLKFSTTGENIVHCLILTNDGNFYDVTTSVTIEGPAYTKITVNLDIKDSTTGALIQGANAGIYDHVHMQWRNTTAPTGLLYYEDSGSTHQYPIYIGGYYTFAAWADGYQYASTSTTIPYDNYRIYLNLVPSSMVSVNGTGTAVINVVRNKDGLPISGASVAVDGGTLKSTNTAGAATFPNITAGTHSVTVSTPDYGYQTAVKTFVINAGETKMVRVDLVLTGETAVTQYQTVTPSTNTTTDLNKKGSNFLEQLLGMAMAVGGLVFLLLFLKFLRKVNQ
jgi:hypothetical protein